VACAEQAAAAETAMLANPAAVKGDELSYALDVDGTRIASGSPGEASAAGAAYVFDCATPGCAGARVVTNGLVAGDRFGAAVALSGDTLVVGAPGQAPGAAYVFLRSGATWAQQARLSASGGTAGDGFGRALALDGDRLVVAAAAADNRAGAAYVFARVGTVWTQQARLGAVDAAAGDSFGRSVALSGDTVLVGAPLKPATAGGSFANGAVYAFVRNGASWPHQAKLVASPSQDGDSFGPALAIDGERAIIGAPLAANRAGSAYVFERVGNAWAQQSQLIPAAGVAGDSFGWSVALSGNMAIVGAPYALNACGANYLFTNTGSIWSETAGAAIGTAVLGDLAGWAVAADHGRWATAAPGHDGPLQHIGAAYWFDAIGTVFGDGFDATGVSACAVARRLERSGV
jgi:hypothetical protein